MANKDPIKISSIVITFVIFLAGSVLSFWIYYGVIQKPIADNGENQSVIEIKKDKLEKIQAQGLPTITTAQDGYGRANPFLTYK